MKKHNLSDFWRGWFIGNFEPSLLKTEQFEVGYLFHPKGENWPDHYHKLGTEYNLLVKGKMKILGETIHEGELFVVEPYEVAVPEFLEDCYIVCVKSPGNKGDKYLVDKENE
jgi:quercetin dioxygenase-like cupin family protein